MKHESKWSELERAAYIEGDTVLAKIYADAMDLDDEYNEQQDMIRSMRQELEMWRVRNEY